MTTDAVRDLVTVDVRDDSRGYLDVLEPERPGESFGLRAMQSPALAAIYERLWRPASTRLFSFGGTGTADADRRLISRLGPPAGHRLLDVACGPGTHTRQIAADADPGALCVGLDFSHAMLTRAVDDDRSGLVDYLRADAHRLPFPDRTFHTVTCLAALYLMPEPLRVLDEMARVLVPGGELVVFTTVDTSFSRLPGIRLLSALSGIRTFGRSEITGHLTVAGLVDVDQEIVGQGQYVTARRPT